MCSEKLFISCLLMHVVVFLQFIMASYDGTDDMLNCVCVVVAAEKE